MRKYKNNEGFNLHALKSILECKGTFRVGIIDADLLDHGTRHPNLALLKISGFCKEKGCEVRLICDYNEIMPESFFGKTSLKEYNLLVMSKVFHFTKIPTFVENMIEKGYIMYGGTGFYEIGEEIPRLPETVEHHMPDYHLYDEYIERATGGDPKLKKKNFDDYLSYSIGFSTRGCIRHCEFCVNRLSNGVKKHSPISEFLDPERPNIYLWDDNIMAAGQLFFQIMDELKQTGKAFQFRQGMDMRLMTAKKAQYLNDAKHHGDYIFAFDHIEDSALIQKKLTIWREHCKKSTKLYVLCGFDSQDEKDIENTFERIRVLMTFGCLPYIMRHEYYLRSDFRQLYVQIARWCNQPGFFKKKSFRQFCEANEYYHQAGGHKDTHCACYQCMLDFEAQFPDIAKKYFDLRYDQLNQYQIK